MVYTRDGQLAARGPHPARRPFLLGLDCLSTRGAIWGWTGSHTLGNKCVDGLRVI